MSIARRPLLAALLIAVTVLAAGSVVAVLRSVSGSGSATTGASRRGPTDPAARLSAIAGDLTAQDPYRDPTGAERRTAVDGLALLLDPAGPRLDSAGTVLGQLGCVASRDEDPATHRRYALFTCMSGERAWGALLVDLSAPVRLAVEVPHPASDLDTERLGAAVFRRIPGALLIMAGAHRQAADGAGDAAHNEASLFHALAVELADRQVPQVQLHGFANDSLPGVDAVVSAGAERTPSPVVSRIATGLAERGFETCRPWRERCGQLEGTTNVQGQAAERAGAPFVHLELSARVRGRASLVDRLADGIADGMSTRARMGT